jgi:hypothetical protein
MNELQQIARVHDKELAGQASGVGAQALLAAIVAEEPVPEPRRRPVKRFVLAATATAMLAAAAVIGPSVVNGKGTATSYASSAIEVWKEGDQWKSRIKDPFANPAEFEKAFRAIDVDVKLELEPSSPRSVGQIFEGGVVERNNYSGTSFFSVTQEPEGCSLTSPGCTMLLSFSTNTAGHHFKVGRPAKPDEAYKDNAMATTKSGSLAGYRVDEKTVGEVVPEIEKRGLKAVYQIINPNPDNYGFTVDANQNAPVGDDWVVWEAKEARLGVVRLLVTDKRYDKNPVYGGPRDKVIKD